jgi:alpha-maltose-1-phosphate synthase
MRVCVGSPGRFYTFDLARQMQRLGHLSCLYTCYPRWKVDGLPQEKVRTFPWLMGPAMLLGRWGFHNVQRQLNRWVIESFDRWMAKRLPPCDVMHCLSSFGLATHRLAKHRYGALTVCDRGSSHIVYQDEILAEEYTRWGVPYQRIDPRIVERELQEYDECDSVVVPSSFTYRTFLRKGVPEAKLARVSYGVDLNLFRPVPKEDDVFRVLYVGTLSLRKGLPYLLEAIAPLKLPNFELWLIGSLLPEALPFLAKYEGQYRYLGIIPRTILYKYYNQGSVLVLPSIEEGLALVQAQAMACGLPVVATTHTGAEDLFTNGIEGFIVPIRCSEAIREKILYLYNNNELREEISRAALRRVQSLGGWDSYGQVMIDRYRLALAHC